MPEPASGPGDPVALEEHFESLYPELRRLAASAMGREREGHTLQPTALVHEAWLRLAQSLVGTHGKAHFLALAARTMRRILIDHSRGRDRLKRGGEMVRITMVEGVGGVDAPSVDLLALDAALAALAAFDDRRAELLEMQFFGGLTYPEMAAAAGISEATVHRELRLARAWLHRELAVPER